MKTMQMSADAIEEPHHVTEGTREMAQIEIRMPVFQVRQSGEKSTIANDGSFSVLAFDSLPWSLENLNRISVRQMMKNPFLLSNA